VSYTKPAKGGRPHAAKGQNSAAVDTPAAGSVGEGQCSGLIRWTSRQIMPAACPIERW
jgi:hypothetical protein